MPKFRKKPVEIDAWHFNGSDEGTEWMTVAFQSGRAHYQGGDRPCITIDTLEGKMRAELGDWIIRGVKGEIYPCKPDIFAATYERESVMNFEEALDRFKQNVIRQLMELRHQITDDMNLEEMSWKIRENDLCDKAIEIVGLSDIPVRQ